MLLPDANFNNLFISIIIIFLSLHQVQDVPALHCTKLTKTRAFWSCVLALRDSVVTMITCALLYFPSIGQTWYFILSYLFIFTYPSWAYFILSHNMFLLFCFSWSCFYSVSSFPSPPKSLINNLVIITEDRILYFCKVLSHLISRTAVLLPLSAVCYLPSAVVWK